MEHLAVGSNRMACGCVQDHEAHGSVISIQVKSVAYNGDEQVDFVTRAQVKAHSDQHRLGEISHCWRDLRHASIQKN